MNGAAVLRLGEHQMIVGINSTPLRRVIMSCRIIYFDFLIENKICTGFFFL